MFQRLQKHWVGTAWLRACGRGGVLGVLHLGSREVYKGGNTRVPRQDQAAAQRQGRSNTAAAATHVGVGVMPGGDVGAKQHTHAQT